MNTYTKLFGSLIHSTVWQESLEVKVVWITMLAMCDKEGEIQASIPGIASAAGVSIAAAESAIEKFLKPDKYSRSPEFEGRRIEPIDGGWILLNHAKYRDLTSDEQMKAQAAKRQRRYRERQKESQAKYDSNVPLRDVALPLRCSNVIVTHTDTDTDTDTAFGASALDVQSTSVLQSKDSFHENFQTAENCSRELFDNSNSNGTMKIKTPKAPKTPKVPKEKKQTNGYNPVAIWLACLTKFRGIKHPVVIGKEARDLTVLGNAYPEDIFYFMIKVYNSSKSKYFTDPHPGPWNCDEFCRKHLEWRSKIPDAALTMTMAEEAERLAKETDLGGDDDAIEAAWEKGKKQYASVYESRLSARNQAANESSGGIPG